MGLNPNFEQQAARTLPLAFGWVQGSGDPQLSTVDQNGDTWTCFILAEGEWDGLVESAFIEGEHLPGNTLTDILQIKNIYNQGPQVQFRQMLLSIPGTDPTNIHFHGGRWSVQHLGNARSSIGLMQEVDLYFPKFPTVTPPQRFSGMAYAIYHLPVSVTIPGHSTPIPTSSTISGVGVFKTTRCRTFDVNGNVNGYGFTCNPAWHIVEAVLRYKLKVEQPPIAGLSDAEKACFNWPSIVAFALRNGSLLSNGMPRFFFSGIFAAEASLTNIMETLLRCSRAYQRVTNGQLYLIGDDTRGPVFILSAKHEANNSLKLSKKNISNSPNQFVARYRDLGIPAVVEVVSASTATDQFAQHDVNIEFNLGSPSPFLAGDVLTYASDPANAWNGSYIVGQQYANGVYFYTDDVVKALGNPGTPTGNFSGGYLGTADSRFAQREASGVQHRSHQRSLAQQAPGVAAQPKIRKVYYDMGTSTFDQTNRIMKFERDSTLGPDTGSGWLAPVSGTITAYLESVDSAGRFLKDVERFDVITLDDLLTPEFAGNYVVKNKTVTAPTANSLAMVELELMTYYPTAYTDVSDPAGDAYMTLPGSLLDVSDTLQPISTVAWTLIATPVGVLSNGSWAITIPNLTMQLGGVNGTTTYPGFSVSGIPDQTNVVLYIDDPSGHGSGATFGFVVGTTLGSQPAGRYLVLVGSFARQIQFGPTPGDSSVQFLPA